MVVQVDTLDLEVLDSHFVKTKNTVAVPAGTEVVKLNAKLVSVVEDICRFLVDLLIESEDSGVDGMVDSLGLSPSLE